MRVFKGDIAESKPIIDLESFKLEAANPGEWGAALRAHIDHTMRDEDSNSPFDVSQFNLCIELLDRNGGKQVVAREEFRSLSLRESAPRFVEAVLKQASSFVRVKPKTIADDTQRPKKQEKDDYYISLGNPSDGDAITDQQVDTSQAVGVGADEKKRSGINTLDTVDLFNLLCIPPFGPNECVSNNTWKYAAYYCHSRRAMLIVDPPAEWTANRVTAVKMAEDNVSEIRKNIGDFSCNAVMYFPRIRMPNPLNVKRLADFAPCGAVAGIIARTDAQHGVWKAPAGIEASFSGVSQFTYTLTDDESDRLSQLGLNCLRSFPVTGNLVCGARTLGGADQRERKYLSVRRMALFLEESLYRGTQWVAFEPNDEPLWAEIRLNIEAFMQNLFRQGAFEGRSPREAYLVKCDRETTTQNDINLGIVNILVGFAPLKPAEFVVIQIQQLAKRAGDPT